MMISIPLLGCCSQFSASNCKQDHHVFINKVTPMHASVPSWIYILFNVHVKSNNKTAFQMNFICNKIIQYNACNGLKINNIQSGFSLKKIKVYFT